MLDGLLAAALGAAALLAPPAHAAPADPSPARGCGPPAPAECLLPFPNDWYTRPDPRTDTGRRVADAYTDHHRVLLHIGYGDHQVANAAADVEARTVGARLLTPALAAGRVIDVCGSTPCTATPTS